MLQTNPLVQFDASNVEHRKAYFKFFKQSKWGPTGPRFILETPFLDVPTMAQSRLVDYYMKKEFK